MDNETKQSYKQSYTDNVELSIFNCGHEYCQPGHTWGPGVRDHYLIHLVVAGRGVYQVNGSSYTLQEGDLFLAKPNQLITYAADETDPWEYYWVGFNGACANKLVQQTPFSDTQPVHRCKDPQAVREALYNIYLSRGPEPQCEALMTGYLYIFMAHLMQAAREAMPNVGSSSSQYVLAAIKYIQFPRHLGGRHCQGRRRQPQPFVPRVYVQRWAKPHRLFDALSYQRGLQPAEEFHPVHRRDRGVGRLL